MTYDLTQLKPQEGSTEKKKRKGRGRSSGMGKTACRGHNGEGQRSGRSQKRGFEGGQMPGYRRVPKLKGFQLVNRIEYAEINVGKLNELGLETVDLEILKEKRIARNKAEALRVLGNGELNKAITVKAAHFSASAKEKIEKSGGKTEIV